MYVYAPLLNVPHVNTFLSTPTPDQARQPTPDPTGLGWVVWMLRRVGWVIVCVTWSPIYLFALILSCVGTASGVVQTNDMEHWKPGSVADWCTGSHVVA